MSSAYNRCTLCTLVHTTAVHYKAFSRRSRAVAPKKCTEKRDARAKLLLANKTCCLLEILAAVAVVVAEAPY